MNNSTSSADSATIMYEMSCSGLDEFFGCISDGAFLRALASSDSSMFGVARILSTNVVVSASSGGSSNLSRGLIVAIAFSGLSFVVLLFWLWSRWKARRDSRSSSHSHASIALPLWRGDSSSASFSTDSAQLYPTRMHRSSTTSFELQRRIGEVLDSGFSELVELPGGIRFEIKFEAARTAPTAVVDKLPGNVALNETSSPSFLTESIRLSGSGSRSSSLRNSASLDLALAEDRRGWSALALPGEGAEEGDSASSEKSADDLAGLDAGAGAGVGVEAEAIVE
jgi:hypothetical protein